MSKLGVVIENNRSRYIKESREGAVFYRASILYIIALYMLPPYFGIPVPGFDLTGVRIMIIVLFAYIVIDYDRSKDFLVMLKNSKVLLLVALNIFVTVYTMLFRADFNAFFNPFIEFVELYLLIYVIKDCVGVDKTIKLVILFLYLLIILGLLESVLKVTPFVILNTLGKHTLYSGGFVRGGHYRIMSNCGHALGYGLLLMTAIPFAGIDVNKKEYDVFKRPFLLIGIVMNVFLTGSRSSLGVLGVEFFLMFILSDKKFLKKNLIIIMGSLILFTVILFCIQSTSFGQYVLLQITSLIDSVFNTTYSIKYGGDFEHMHSSSSYRKLLWKVFTVDWINPLLGIGRKRNFSSLIDGIAVSSIDNFYVVEYIGYAYPGLIAYVAFMLYMLLYMLVRMVKTKSAITRMLFIGTVGYYIHLTIADSLATLKYLYVLFAIFLCMEDYQNAKKTDSIYFGKKGSKYVR